jgi:hypothetical protein
MNNLFLRDPVRCLNIHACTLPFIFISIDLKPLLYRNDIFLSGLQSHIDSPTHISSEMGTLFVPFYAKIAVLLPLNAILSCPRSQATNGGQGYLFHSYRVVVRATNQQEVHCNFSVHKADGIVEPCLTNLRLSNFIPLLLSALQY